MARRFLRLKFALVRAGFRSGNTAMVIGAVLSLIAGFGAGVGGLIAGVALRWAPDDVHVTVVEIGLAAILVAWVLGPVTVAGTDASMDPTKLVLLPLTRRDLAVGLTGASLVGPGGLATLPTVLGVVVGMAPLGPGAIAVVLGGVVFIGLCVVTSRLVITLLGFGLRRRGTRDVVAVAVPLVVIVLSQLPNLVLNAAPHLLGEERSRQLAGSARGVLRFLPSSLPTGAITAGSRGDLPAALAELAGGVVLIVLLGAWWARLLQTVMTQPAAEVSGGTSVHRRRLHVVRLLPWLPVRAAAVADKDVILLFREPAQRVQVIIVMVLASGMALGPVVAGARSPGLAYLSTGLGLLLGMVNSNAYGYDGSSTWMNVAAGDDARSDLLGKGVARLIVFTPLILVITLLLGGLFGPRLLLGSLGCSLGAWFASLGISLAQSVIAPYPVTYSENGLMARNNGTFTAVAAQFVAFPILGVCVAPFLFLGLLNTDRTAVLAASGLGALAVGAGVGYGAYRLAVTYSTPRQPELLQAISKRAEA